LGCILDIAGFAFACYIRVGEYIGKGQSTSQPDFQGIFGPDETENPLSSDARRDVRRGFSEGFTSSSADRIAPPELLEESGFGGNTQERALGSLSAGSGQNRLPPQPFELFGPLLPRCS
jgi:hypothetical protein